MTEAAENELLIKEATKEPLCHELLRFMVTHPYTRFNRPALVHLFGLTKASLMEEALDKMIALRVVEGQKTGGFAIFWLTREEPLRSQLISWFEKGGRSEAMPWSQQLTMPLGSCPV